MESGSLLFTQESLSYQYHEMLLGPVSISNMQTPTSKVSILEKMVRNVLKLTENNFCCFYFLRYG